MTYPDGIDALVNVNATDTLAAGGHAARHNSVNTALVEVKDYLVGALGSKLNIAGGKILQIVRATDSTNRTTTSTTFVDANISVTITPQKSDSIIVLIWSNVAIASGLSSSEFRISDASNNPISGAERSRFTHHANGYAAALAIIGYATPATTSAITYKGRFNNNTGVTTTLENSSSSTGQLYAIEVSA
jgi:hypothetical protein